MTSNHHYRAWVGARRRADLAYALGCQPDLVTLLNDVAWLQGRLCDIEQAARRRRIIAQEARHGIA